MPSGEFEMSPLVRTHLPTDVAEFEALIAPRRPVIFESALADWRCTKEGSEEYLKKAAGSVEIVASVSQEPLFQGNPKTGHYTANQMRKMKFGDFLDAISANAPESERLYAHKQNLFDTLPALREDIRIPEVIRDRTFVGVNLWMGPRGSITQLHHDFNDNLFTMVRGRKRVIMFDWKEEGVGRFPFKSMGGRSSWHLSDVGSADRVDIALHPDFPHAERIEVIVEPGDMLYIPNFWWHEVESLDQPSISLSMWWGDRPWSSVEESMRRITAFAEDYQSMDPEWRAFVRNLLLRDVM
jgi:[protein]-arginine 3-hydroxylase / protease